MLKLLMEEAQLFPCFSTSSTMTLTAAHSWKYVHLTYAFLGSVAHSSAAKLLVEDLPCHMELPVSRRI